MSGLNENQLDQIRRELGNGRKIAAIKLYKDWTRCSLLEAKNAVEAIQKNVEIPEPRQARDESIDDDELRQVDDAIAKGKKLDAVKLYRQFTGCSLMESKAFVESRMSKPVAPQSTSAVQTERSGCFSIILLILSLSVGSASAIYLRI